MKHHTRLLVLPVLFALALLLSPGCNYPLDDTVFTEVDPVGQPEEISLFYLDELDGDTLAIADWYEFIFLAYLKDVTVYRAEIYLDSTEVFNETFYDYNDTIELKLALNKAKVKTDGYHPLQFRIYYKTDSMPLEDMLTEKNNVVTREITVKYYTEVPAPQVTYFGIEDGRPAIRWEASDILDFMSYNVFVGYYDEDSVFRSLDTEIGIGREDTYFVSNIIASTEAVFRLQTVCYPDRSEFVEYVLPFDLGLSMDSTDRMNVVLSWNKTPFYNNFGKVRVFFNNDESYELTDINDTTITVLNGLRKYNTVCFSYYTNYCTGCERSYWLPMPLVSESFHTETSLAASSQPPYFIYGVDRAAATANLFRYTPGTGEYLEGQLGQPGTIKVAANGAYVYDGLNYIDPLTLENEELDLGNKYFISDDIAVSGISNIGVCSGLYLDVYIYDLVNQKKLNTLDYSYYYSFQEISPDSRYLVYFDQKEKVIDFWKYDSLETKFMKISSLAMQRSYAADNLVFVADEDRNEFYTVGNDGGSYYVERWSCETQSILETFETSGRSILNIDPVNQNIVTFGNGRIYIHDATTKEEIYQAALDYSFTRDNVTVVNSVVYSPIGMFDFKEFE